MSSGAHKKADQDQLDQEAIDAKAGSKAAARKSLSSYLKGKRNEIIVAVIGFLLTTVIVGTVLALGQEWLKKLFFTDGATAEMVKRISHWSIS